MKPEKTNVYKTPIKKLGLYILISVWMFLLGVFVGRGMVTVKFGEEPNAEQAKEIYSTEVNLAKGDPKTDSITEKENLEYYEALRGSDYNRFSDKQIIIQAKALQDAVQTSDTNKTEKAKAPKKKDKKIDKKPKEQKNIFLVQAASFLSKQDAEKFIRVLKRIGYEAYISSTTKKGKVWHRVRIGPFKNETDADKVLKALEKERINPIILTITKG
ncbi:MAG: SPOR domain-containing protein [Deltaproteobacteria bacterium]|nr:SPOR domain-containing protein [Deltaproteobacteria bacterium]